jgi:hypothetical protein
MASLGALLAVVSVCIGCSDHGGAYIVENKTDQEILARVTGRVDVSDSSGTGFGEQLDVFSIEPNSRLAVAIVGFASRYSLQTIDIVSPDCALIAEFGNSPEMSWARDGSVIVVEPGPTATLRDEHPIDGTMAERVERCTEGGG